MNYNTLKWNLLLLMIACIGFVGCSKDDDADINGGPEVVEPEFQPSVYNLNIVYFSPSDQQPFADSDRRINDIMLWVQEFYRKEMIRNGFGNRTFGLNKNSDGLVKIIYLKGKEAKDGYAANTAGSTKISIEVEEYFSQHPEEKTSEHTMILQPSRSKNNMTPGGTPFIAQGRTAYVMDYRYFELKYYGLPTDEGELFCYWLGGLAHEVGHAMNLCHDAQKVSEEKTLGTSLMGAGNSTLGLKPTFITEAGCAILNTSQAFAPQKKDVFYGLGNNANIRSMRINFEEEYIRFNAGFDLKKVPLVAANLYFDNLPAIDNQDYDAESWHVKVIGRDSISCNIPWNELHKPRKDFQIRVMLIYEDGSLQKFIHDFKYKDGKLEDYEF